MASPKGEEEKALLQAGADTTSSDDSSRDETPTGVPPSKRRFNLDAFLPCDPSRWLHRYLMLALMCFLSFGSYYVYDNPTALQRTIINVMKINTTQYTLLYSLYSWPNVVLSVFGGFLLDRVFGIRWGAIIFSIFVCLGQLVFSLGAFFNSFITMVAGRFIFGLGGENLAVAQNAYTVVWFKGKELNMVFGILLSVSRISSIANGVISQGSTVNMNINQKMFDTTFLFVTPLYVRLGTVLFIGLGFCLFSLGCAFLLGLFDWRAERILNRKGASSGEKISIMDVKKFPLRLWVIFIVCVAYYVTIFPFIGLATVFLMDKYMVSNGHANIQNSLVYIISAVVSPFLGILVDKTGFNLFWLNLGIVLTLVGHAMFAFLPSSVYIAYLAMATIGVAYSFLACALWPLVAFIMPEYQLGTAYGIMQAIQNLGLAVITIVAGVIVDNCGYLMLEVFFLANLCIALIAGIVLYVLDSSTGGLLNMSAWARAKQQKKEEEGKKKSLESQASEKIPINTKDGTTYSEVTVQGGLKMNYTSPISPNSAFHIRNRMMSKMGAKLPDHIAIINPLSTVHPHIGVLK